MAETAGVQSPLFCEELFMVDIHYSCCADYRQENLDRALTAVLMPLLTGLGGIAGKSVMIKPNLLEYHRENDPASVHPQLLLALCRFLKEHGASRIAVIENPAVRTADAVVRSMGIMAELEKLGVTVKNCTNYEKVSDMPERCRNRQLEIATEFREYDLFIDFAKAKTHAMMTLTCGVKNLFGLIRGSERLSWHLAVGRNFDDFADMLLDIYLLAAPQITLLDAITGMEGNGPGSGDPVELGFLCASKDALALDASVAEKLGVADTPVLRRGRARNLLMAYRDCGEVPQVHKIRLPEKPDKMLEWGVYFPVKLRELLRKMLLSHPVVDKKKCISCGLCAQKCPPQTLKMRRELPQFDYAGCIRCYCCQEFCPQGAITVAQSGWMKVLSGAEKVLRKLNINRKSGKRLILVLLFALAVTGGYFLAETVNGIRQFDQHMSERKDAAATVAETGNCPESADDASQAQEAIRQAEMCAEQALAQRDAAIVARSQIEAEKAEVEAARSQAVQEAERANERAAVAVEKAEESEAVREFLHSVIAGMVPAGEDEPEITALAALKAKLPEISGISPWRHRRAVAVEAAQILSGFDDWESALPLLQMAYALDMEHRPVSAEAVQSGKLLGDLCFVMEDFASALEYFRISLQTARQVFGENHAETAAGCHRAGSACNASGNYSGALEYFRKSLEIYQAIHEGESRETAVANYAIGVTLVKLGQRREAVEFLQKAAGIAGRILGADHPYTRQFTRDLQQLQPQEP